MHGRYQAELTDCNQELSKIKTWIDKNKLDSNVRYLVSYAVIKASGTIENICKQMIFDHLVQNANEEAITYFTKGILNSSSNPSTGQIQKLLQQVNGQWASDFESKINGSSEKSQLNSLVKLRNSFSHGSNITSSIDEVILFINGGCWILEKLYEIIYTT